MHAKYLAQFLAQDTWLQTAAITILMMKIKTMLQSRSGVEW